MSDSPGPILLYDGYCGFCNWAVRTLLAVDREGLFRFAPLHGEYAAGLLAKHPGLADVDSLVVVEGEAVSVRSDALLHVAARLGGVWKLLLVFGLIPRPLRDWAYDVFARHRYRLFGRYDECPVPPPEVRGRFLS